MTPPPPVSSQRHRRSLLLRPPAASASPFFHVVYRITLISGCQIGVVFGQELLSRPCFLIDVGSRTKSNSDQQSHMFKVIHNKRGFKQQWLSITFSKAIFLGNGLVAILAGLFGNLLVGSLAIGLVAPFDATSIFLAIGMAITMSSWTENYGDSSERKDLMTQFRGVVVAIASDVDIPHIFLTRRL
ncbi:unnamed protein product [Lactuca virosa]|uniref:Uncharacterized protein n=1 Tax=Lactuca virosa TaxID=75947 RepID=A0AAU9N825_9ASTR|nr:unnamed protein product [Lactuca virosa]